ncbi:MAG: transporter substrate-binding domain-containing protein [Thomasclavelia ramosa]
MLDYAVAKNYDSQDAYRMIDEALLEEENLIIANKDSQELMDDVNKALDEFIKSDKYTELKEKWGA